MAHDRAVALGFFDGIHLGHAALLNRTRLRASQLGLRAAAMSFDTHPDTLVFGSEVPLLNTMAERELLMRRLCGIEEVVFAHFDAEMMHMPWQMFVTEYLAAQLGAKYVVCGHDYRFGDRGTGDAEKLQALCRELGIGCDIIPEITLEGKTVSSTCIRQLLQAGECQTAARFLGHGHLISATVQRGAGRGAGLGFPTANLPLAPGILVPAFGVYRAEAEIGGRRYPAVANLGVHPTVGALAAPILETNLIGFSGDLYGKELTVWLQDHLRGERAFHSAEELRAQVLHDRRTVAEFYAASET